ncbi:unnamed protein product [Ceutorhynchus assimilis]|uniref:RING-type domain-containing protein n=1 Tax=Ceutorhynchus assimilis TaxID=467358 RepID=A0A9P0GKF9_9CUCU|nr:unnamed protein product [Ceutorhynchus assimilis]
MNIEQNRLETFNDWPADASVSPQRIAKADPASSGNIPAVVSPLSIPSSSFPLDYKNESERLASFDNWPIPQVVSPEDLARAGFYSLKNGDNTKCAFCKGVVRAWEPNDIPDVEHKRHFPACPFVITTINPRLHSSDNGQLAQGTTFRNVNIINNSIDGNLDQLGVQKHNGPKRADYGTVEARLRTFSSWSPHLIQTPDLLAQAGFYYEGMNDQVRCFHCDGGLRHWDPDDDPWTEHARWFPRCSFVNLVKGQDFVTACSLENLNSSNGQNSKIQAKKRRQVSNEELQAHMISEPALTALGIGIDVQRVRRAMKEKLELTGQGYSHADALVEASLNMQLEEEDGFENPPLASNQIRNNLVAALIDFSKGTDNGNTDQTLQPNIPQQSSTPPDCPRGQFDACAPSGVKFEKSVSLEEENRILKEARQCKICMDAEVGIVFLPCGHLATCVNCAPNLEDCPVCRSVIKAAVRTFLS